MADQTAAPPEQKKKSKRRVLVFGILLFVLLGGAGGGFWFWQQSAAKAAPEPRPARDKPGAVLSLEPFLVNLADAEASRFLRVTIRLVVDDEHDAKTFETSTVRKAQLRSAILELLTTQRSSELVTPEGKSALRASVAQRSTDVLKLEIRDVLFTDFVVQF